MAFEKGKRRKIINLVRVALEGKLYFREVKAQMPTTHPTGDLFPSAFVALLPETIEDMTNEERRSDFRLAVIVFVKADKDVDLLKVDAQEEAEEAIMALQTDSSFRAVATRIGVDTTDPGPVALHSFGLEWTILPPFGVVRLDVGIDFAYDVI